MTTARRRRRANPRECGAGAASGSGNPSAPRPPGGSTRPGVHGPAPTRAAQRRPPWGRWFDSRPHEGLGGAGKMNDESAGESKTSLPADLHDGTCPPRGEGWTGACTVDPGPAAGPVRHGATTQTPSGQDAGPARKTVLVQQLQDSATVQEGTPAEQDATPTLQAAAGNYDSEGTRRRPVHSPVPMEEDPAPPDTRPAPRAVPGQGHSAGATHGGIVHFDVTVQEDSAETQPRTLHFIFPGTDELMYVAVPVNEVVGLTGSRTMRVTIRTVDGFSGGPARRETRAVRFADPVSHVRVYEDEPEVGNNVDKEEEEDDGYRGVVHLGELMDEDPGRREPRAAPRAKPRRQGRRVRFSLPSVEEPAWMLPWTVLLASPEFAGADPHRGQDADPALQDAGGSQLDAGGTKTDAGGVEVVAIADAEGMEVDVRVIEVDAEGMETDDEGIEIDAGGIEIDAEGVETDAGEPRHPFVHFTIDMRQDPAGAVSRGAQAAAAAAAGSEDCVEREPPAEQREGSGPAGQAAAGVRAAPVVGRSLSFFKCYHCLFKQTCEVCRVEMTGRQLLAYRVLHKHYDRQRLWARREKVRSLNAELQQGREEDEEDKEEEKKQEEEKKEEDTEEEE